MTLMELMLREPKVMVPELGKLNSAGFDMLSFNALARHSQSFSNDGGAALSVHLIIMLHSFSGFVILKNLVSTAS